MFYLAAAVSDFYIPASEMPEHKIQSSNGPLQVSESKFCYTVTFPIFAKLEVQLERYQGQSTTLVQINTMCQLLSGLP